LIRILLASLLLLPAVPSRAKSRPAAPPVDRHYTAALATADRFLQAWQTRDSESGISLLTDRARRRTDENSLQHFFATGDPQSSFEIGRGKRLAFGRYAFPVSLFHNQPQPQRRWSRPQISTLVVVRAGKHDWAIDKLP
jgi:hypothetical protein